MRKKILCLLLAISICLVPFTLTTSAEEVVQSADVELLRALGILEEPASEGLYETRFHYTRDKFAKALTMMEYDSAPQSEEPAAARDIADNEYIKYINFVLNTGLMRCDEKNNFNPKGEVTLADAARGFVTLLGYETLAEEQGGTDDAYIFVANKLGILRGITISNTEKLDMIELAKMIMRAMRTMPAVPSNEVISPYELTLMEKKELKQYSGRIIANENAGILVDPCGKGQVNIEGKVYFADCIIDDILVGANVTYYTRETDGRTAVVSVYADTNVLSLEADELEEINFTDSYVELTYDEEEVAKIGNTAFVLVNGINYSLTQDLFDAFDSGTIKMRDTDEDGIYDVVHIELYATETVQAAGTESNKIITKYTAKTINFSDIKKSTIIRDGFVIELDAISPGDVINVSCDAFSITGGVLQMDYDNATRVMVRASNKKVIGVVTAVTGNETIEIDGVAYHLSNYLLKRILDNDLPAFAPGQPVIAVFDAFNQLVYYELDSENITMEYGYLIASNLYQSGLTKAMYLKILTDDGNVEVFEVAEKYILDGQPGVKSDHLVNAATGLDLRVQQLLRYRATDGIIKELDTEVLSALESSQTSLYKDYEGTDKVYRNRTFEMKCVVDDNRTVIFRVPPVSAGLNEEVFFNRISRKELTQDKKYTAAGYNLDYALRAGCVVVYENKTSADMNYKDLTFMVGDSVKCLNNDGVVATRIELMGRTEDSANYGVKLNLYVDEDVVVKSNYHFRYGDTASSETGNDLTLADIKKGDIIRYQQNSYEEITYIELVFSPSQLNDFKPFTLSGGWSAYVRAYDAYTVDYVYTMFCVSTAADESVATAADRICFLAGYMKTLYVYHAKTGKITKIDNLSDLPTYLKASDSTLFIQGTDSDVANYFVFSWD